MSAAAKVGSSLASTCPPRTESPGLTSIERMIAVSKGATTSLGSVVTSLPGARTILSIGA